MEHLRCINFYPCMYIGDVIIYVTTTGKMYERTIRRFADIREYEEQAYDSIVDTRHTERRNALSEDTFVCRQVKK